jgi:hypothetical protein
MPPLVGQAYIAMGLSQSMSMPDTSAIECVQQTPGTISAHASWTVGRTGAFRAQSVSEVVEIFMKNDS